jgi:hypothetical protein
VTQILAGYSNLTVSTLVAAAAALDTKVSVELVPTTARSVAAAPDVEGWTTPPPQLKRVLRHGAA